MNSGWKILVGDPCPEGVLNALWEAEVPFSAVELQDAVTLGFRVPYREKQRVLQLLRGRGSQVLQVQALGLYPRLGRMARRSALLLCGLVCALLLAVSNLFVWRIDVKGNETIPTGTIVRAMESLGAGIGSFWVGFDAEALRTQLQVALPELQWVGISYHSGVVQVEVREQREAPTVVDNRAPTHVVSRADGIITDMEVKLGQSAVAVGDTVQQGQLLISGAAKSTLGTTRMVHALGQVEARTWRTLTVRQPATVWKKGDSGRISRKISVILWGKPINFYIGSSFSGGTCDKIILNYHLQLDGVLHLPVQVVVQEYVHRDLQQRQLSEEQQEALAQEALMEALQQLVGEGEILATELAFTHRQQVLTATVKAECREQIGEEVPISQEELRQIQMEDTLGEEQSE